MSLFMLSVLSYTITNETEVWKQDYK